MRAHYLLPPASTSPVRRAGWVLLRVARLVIVASCWMGISAHAAPEAGDAVSRFLQSKGLVRSSDSSRPGLLNDVRTRASDLVLTAMNFLGVPYRRGGTSEETGFDCSGFTRHVFENSLGLLLPRRSAEQAQSDQLLSVGRDDLKPGDLVFFNTMRHAFSHVGIYIGDGKFIHSPRTGSEVRVEDMREAYWIKRYNGARRAPTLTTGNPIKAEATP